MREAVILFAHGSREPGWHEPLLALRARLQAAMPEARVLVAYLERSEPDLAAAVEALAAEARAPLRCTVVPFFLGLGGHVARDLPVLVDGLRRRYPGSSFAITGPVGADPAVLDAMAGAIELAIVEAGASGGD